MDTQKDDVLVTSTIDSSKKKNTKKYVLIVGIVLVLAMLAFYFLYFIKTPVYSLYEIRTAVQTKNVLLLEKRADLNSVYGSAFDDYVSSSLDGSGISNPLAITMVKFMKPTIVDNLVERTKTAVRNGEFAKDTKEENKKETSVSKVYPIKESPNKEKAKEKISRMKNFKLSGVKDTVIVGDTAIVSAEVLDKKNNKIIIVDLKMAELNDGTWQLVKVDNFKEVLKELNFPAFNELVK